ncbi:signal peptidase II [Halalkalibacillus sediminis]|uniref:Lipoprotein signal peptidase n=1 Tax=Halalkalibacillus sediminis TaxID=2018042 RepID=A0A2I0QW63_9BACI|nr:signal peptidase II [Halalkalibacillus sediminis]PKR78554.1 signal peptidase II [Halalkalibacillus sediminis]
MRYYILALIVIIFDQATKWMIVYSMDLHDQIELIPGFLFFTSHRNSGAAWGILEGQMWLFYIVTVIVIAGIVYYMNQMKDESPFLLMGFGLVLGGAIGNFIDRIFLQEVIDFIDVIIFGYDFPIFNIADAALSVGVVLLIIMILIDEWNNKGVNSDE